MNAYRYWSGMLLLLILALPACTSTQNGAAYISEVDPADDSPVAFSVAGKAVTVNDYQERIKESIGPAIEQLLMQGQTPEQITEMADQQNVRQAIFDDMIQEELLLQAARQEGIGVDAAEVDARVEEQQQLLANATDPTAPQPSELELRETIARQQIIQQMYLKHITADMFKSKHILVEDEATAQEIVAKLDAGGDFAELAKEYSKDPGSAENGGEYGWIPRGEFVPEYEEAAFSAELNTPVIVKSDFGYHVIIVEDRAENRPFDSFDQLNSSRTAQMHYEETFVPWYNGVRQEAESNGTLWIDPQFSPLDVPLPFPDQIPAAPAPPDGIIVVTPQSETPAAPESETPSTRATASPVPTPRN